MSCLKKPKSCCDAACILPNSVTVHGFGEDNNGELYALVTNSPANGTWTLRVQDVYYGDSGYINSWTLTL